MVIPIHQFRSIQCQYLKNDIYIYLLAHTCVEFCTFDEEKTFFPLSGVLAIPGPVKYPSPLGIGWHRMVAIPRMLNSRGQCPLTIVFNAASVSNANGKPSRL